MEKIPNLVNEKGSKLKDLEQESRNELFSYIKNERNKRDSLLKESSKLKTRLKSIFGENKSKSLKMEATDIQRRLYGETKYRKEKINKKYDEKSLEIINETVKKPILNLISILKKIKEGPELGNYESEQEYNKLQEKSDEIIDNFNFQNIIEGLNEPLLRDEIVNRLNDFFENPELYKILFINDVPGKPLTKETNGFPIDLAKTFLFALNNKIEKNGTSDITNKEEMFNFFKLIEKSKEICLYQKIDPSIETKIISFVEEKGLQIDIWKLSKLGSLIDFVVEKSQEFKNKIDTIVQNVFEVKNWSNIYSLCQSNCKYLSESGLRSLDIYLKQKYGINASNIKSAWNLYPLKQNKDYPINNIEENIIKMDELESKRPGIVKCLFSEFGIKEFHRYPTNVLIKQFDTKNQDVPYGIVLFTNNDHNDAFDADKEIIESVFEQTDNKILMRIAEFESKVSVLKNLALFNKRYGEKNKITYLILGAHGWERSIGDIAYFDLDGKGALRVKDFFVDNPEIILVSCSTGAEKGMAQKLSENYNATVHAPSIPTSLKNISVDFNEINKPHFKVEFRENNINKTYSSGKENNS
jgi:regulator of replication initiation timing